MSIKGLFKTLNINHHIKGKGVALALASGVLAPHSVAAQDNDWWFEVELIVFKRVVDPASVDEAFNSDLSVASTRRQFDLLTPYLQPNLTLVKEGLPMCFEQKDEGLQLELPAEVFSLYPQLMDQSIDLSTLSQDSSWQTSDVAPTYGYQGGDSASFSDQTEVSANNNDHQESMEDLERAFSLEAEVAQNPRERLVEQKNQSTLTLPAFSSLQNVRLPDSLACVFEQEQFYLASPLDQGIPTPFIDQVPARLNGTEWLYSSSPYLVGSSSLQLSKLARDIARQRGVDGLLHMGWRQNVLFGQNKAPSMRLFAGKNFANLYDAKGKLIPVQQEEMSELAHESGEAIQQVDLLTQIKQALKDPQFVAPEQNEQNQIASLPVEKVRELWELDGYFKVFLRYIKRTPYLHIESELDYRAPMFSELNNTDALLMSADESNLLNRQPDQLKSFKFKQLRRVISKQIHYFDHPLFGMVVQIRRHHKPKPPVTEQTDLAYSTTQ